MISAESKIIDPYYGKRLDSPAGSASDDAQQGAITHGQHQSPREARCRPAAKREAQTMNDAIQPWRPPGMARKNRLVEAFSENLLPTIFRTTEEAARDKAQGENYYLPSDLEALSRPSSPITISCAITRAPAT